MSYYPISALVGMPISLPNVKDRNICQKLIGFNPHYTLDFLSLQSIKLATIHKKTEERIKVTIDFEQLTLSPRLFWRGLKRKCSQCN